MKIIMLKRHLLGAAIPALFQTGTAFAAPPVVQREEPVLDLGNMDVSAISLAHAVTVVENNTGGKVMTIRFEGREGRGGYEAVVVRPGEVGRAWVDAQTGEVTAHDGDSTPDQALKREDQRDIRSFEKATVSLTEAIATVEKLAGAPVVNAGLAKPLSPDNDVLAYNIEVVKNGRPEGIAVDATTDEVIANPGALGLANRDPAWFLPITPQ